jgi:hypothetical protein
MDRESAEHILVCHRARRKNCRVDGGNWRAASGNTFQYPVQKSISKLFKVSALEL